ncbi:MAG: hypothetical protein V3S54_01970 [Woeseiaceae bacterium]
MSKSTGKAAVKATVGISKVANAIAKAYATQAESGNVITQVCKVAAQVFKGKDANTTDLKEIAKGVARQRGWTPASAGPRMSEVRKIVRNYKRIPEAVTSYMRKHETFSWHTAMRLITCLNREPALNQALKLMDVGNAVKLAAKPAKVIALAVSRIMNVDTRSTSIVNFQTALESLAEKHGVNW